MPPCPSAVAESSAVKTCTELASHLSSASSARKFVRDCLARFGLASDEVELVASELVANVATHASSPIKVALEVDERVRLVVSDGSAVIPAVIDAALDAEHGRGLFIVEAFSAAWGVDLDGPGKSIWAEFDRAECARI